MRFGKKKLTESKYELQKQKIAVKRARGRRDSLFEELSKERINHRKTQNELNQKETEIKELKMQLERASQQVEEFKKKQSLCRPVDLAIIRTGTAS